MHGQMKAFRYAATRTPLAACPHTNQWLADVGQNSDGDEQSLSEGISLVNEC